ncbi:MAG: AAA family ATPase [Caldilineaceae bacterium]
MGVIGLEGIKREIMVNAAYHPSTKTTTASDETTVPPIRIYAFGTLQVVRADHTVTESDWHTRQARQLLKILITERPQPVSTDRLIDLLWPNSAPAAAATTLRSAINALRNVLEPDRRSRAPSKYIITKTPGYAFSDHADIWLDVAHFESLLNRSDGEESPTRRRQLLEEAIELYQDDYLNSDPYADWAQNEREQLQERYFSALLALADLRAAEGNFTAAIAACRRIIARDPVRENAYQALMRYQAESGDSASALLTYERCRTLLAEDLGADPSPLTQAWHQQILNGEIGPQQVQQRTFQPAVPMSPIVIPAPAHLGEIVLPVQQLSFLGDRGESDAVTPTQANAEEDDARFVGREAEMARLMRHVRQAKQKNGSLLLLDGEAGVGKTHLAHHLLQQVVGPELTVIHATCQPLEQQLPFAPLSDGLGRFLHTLSDAALRALPAVSLAQLAQLTPSLQDRLPDLPVSTVETIGSSDENRQRLINGLIALLTTLAEIRPLLFFLDDLQWADSETLAVLGRLAQRLPQLPIFLLLAYRSGELVENQALETLIHTLRRTNPQVVQQIRRFDQQEVAHLAKLVLGEAITNDVPVIELLYQTTQGNPLFVTEALRALQERHALPTDAAPTQRAAPVAQAVPTTSESMLGLVQNPRVQEIILERVRRLPPTARNLLHLCAVIGRDFSLDLLEQVTPTEAWADLVTDVEILLQRKFLVERADERLDFSHQIVRQVAYENMSVLQRRRLHLRVAAALAAARRAVEMPGEIAFHYRQSGSSADDQVAHYSVLAGERLLHSFGFTQAVEYFSEALRLLNRADKAALPWIGRALQGLGLAYESLFDPVGITETYRQLQEWARTQNDRASLLTAYSRQTSMLGLLGQQRESNELLLKLMEALLASAASSGTTIAERSAAVIRDLISRRQAIYQPDDEPPNGTWVSYTPPPPVVEEPVAAILDALEPVHAVLPLFEYGWALLVQGQLDGATHCLNAAVALARQTDQPSIAGIAYHQLAITARMMGDLEQCYALNEESLAMNRTLQGRAGELVSLWPRIGSGFSALAMGNVTEAERRFQHVADFLEALEAFRNHYNSATIGLGLVALVRGNLTQAKTMLQRALADVANLYPYTHVQALLGLARIAAAEGDEASCRTLLQRALAFAGRRSLVEEYVVTLLAMSQLLSAANPTAALIETMLAYVKERNLPAFVEKLQQAQAAMVAR